MNRLKEKKSFRKSCAVFIFILLLICSCSCIRVEYTGTADPPLAPLADDANIVVCYSFEKLPAPLEMLKKAGTLAASGSTASTTVNDMRNKIMECARLHGANVVLFTSVEYIPDGGARADQIQNISAPGWDRVDNTRTNVKQEWRAFLYAGKDEQQVPIYTVKMKADLYYIPAERLKRKAVPQKRKPSFPIPEGKNEPAIKVNVL